jgi:hypothetical protein
MSLNTKKHRPVEQVKRTPRTDQPNEKYYALFDHPSFNQFGDNYHFTDEAGRRYQLATDNDDTFQNHLLRGGPDGTHCVQDGWGHIKLFVKLYKRQSEWFSDQQLDRPLVLYGRGRGHNKVTYVVRIESTHKPDYKHRTGQIFVSGGLTPLLCNALLREQQRNTGSTHL